MHKRAAAIAAGEELVNQQTARYVLQANQQMYKEAANRVHMTKTAAAVEEISFRDTLEKLAQRER